MSRAAAVAVGLVMLEAAVTWAQGPSAAGPFLLLAACGFAFVPFVPLELRRPSLIVPLLPVVAVALASLAVVSTATFGFPLTPFSIRVTVLLLALASLGLSGLPHFRNGRESSVGNGWRSEFPTLLLLAAILALAAALYDGVVGRTPVPGMDWGHYLLYAERISKEHALLLTNPLSLNGELTFSEDPGAPSLYGAFLLVGDQEPGVLVHGIVLFSLLGILAVFIFAAALWGSEAGLIAAGLWAVLPAGMDVLAWHGLATTYALAMFPLAAVCVAFVCRGRADWRWALLLAVSGAAIVGGHRMTAVVALVALAPALAVGLLRQPRRGARYLAYLTGAGIVVAAGLLTHTVQLLERTGHVADYRSFLVRKIEWSNSVRDITWIVVVGGLLGLIAMAAQPLTRRDPALLVPIGMALGAVSLSYAWVVHVPLDYIRMGTYLAIPLVVAFGAAWAQFIPRQALALAVLPILVVANEAHDVAPKFRAFYQIADPATLRGLDDLDKRAKAPTAPIVTDQCWSFLVPWLLQRHSLAAYEEWTIPFQQDLEPARLARRILYGGAAGRRLARQMGVRYVVLDPKCSSWSVNRSPVTIRGTPLYASTRLLVLQLPAASG